MRNVSEVTLLTDTILSLPLEPLAEGRQVGMTIGMSSDAFFPARTSQEIPTKGSETVVFLQRGNCQIPLGHGNLLRDLGKFKGLPSRNQIRTLENDAIQVNLHCFLIFLEHAVPFNRFFL